MAYTMTIWNEKAAPGISGKKLNNIEQGIYSAHKRVDNLTLNTGDSSAECVDARVSSDGTTYTTLKNRLDEEYKQVSGEIEEVKSGMLFTVNDKNEICMEVDE